MFCDWNNPFEDVFFLNDFTGGWHDQEAMKTAPAWDPSIQTTK